MARLIEVFRYDEHPPLLRRQSPLMIEDHLMMVMDLNMLELFREDDPEDGELDEFLGKFALLSERDLKEALQVDVKDVLNIVSESIPCVGCRRSVERLYYQLMEVGTLAMDPLIVNSKGKMVILDEVQIRPILLCSLLGEHSERLARLVSSQPRNKKSRRCVLHSWDLQKARPVTPAWKDVWAVMEDKCKAEVLLIDFSMLLSKLENYLKKHRFCQDCRTKVMKAYHLLVEDGDPTKEKGFVPHLYHKIKRCTPGKHIHLPTETKYIDSLIARAEPELLGNRRDRHAKTMEIAQEEVLTCVGMCIYDRLHRIYLRLREEEFTCLVLASAGVEALARSFGTYVEKKRGFSPMDLLCFEITQEEVAKRQRKEMKKLRRKKKKERKNDDRDGCECESDNALSPTEESSPCECPKVKAPESTDRRKLQILDRKSKRKCECEECQERRRQEEEVVRSRTPCEPIVEDIQCTSCQDSRAQDGGYGSEHNLPSSGSNSSPDGSEVACSEGFCDHDGDCGTERGTERPGVSARIAGLSLKEMLEQAELSEDGEAFSIPQEEIRAFKARSRQVDEKRLELRVMLKNKFDQLCIKAQTAPV